jgi:hypothetical protein
MVCPTYSSPVSGFLCFGLFRRDLGSIGRDDGTVPIRSRASFRTSFFMSKDCFLRAKAGFSASSISRHERPRGTGGTFFRPRVSAKKY